MMEQQIVTVAEVHELAVIARTRLEAMIGGLDEDLRSVTGVLQDPLNAQHFVPDGVAVAERRKNLMNANHAGGLAASAGGPSAGPWGSCASTSRAAGISTRRRSSQPPWCPSVPAMGSFLSRS